MQIKRKNMYSLLIVLFLCLGIGYAALSTNLSINGISHVDSASWDVYWSNVQVTSGSVTAPTPTITNKTSVSFAVTLEKPGDFFEFTVDAVNAGSIDAMIESIHQTINGNPISQLPVYLSYTFTYSDELEIENNHVITAGNQETYLVRLEYKKDLNPEDLPSSNDTINIGIQTDYIQRNSSGVVVFHPVPAEDLLITNPNGSTPEEKSPYVLYKSVDGDDPIFILCRVLYDATSPYGLQIITDDSVENVTLGNDSSDISGINAYNNAIYTLNLKSLNYRNGYLSKNSRCVGSTPDSTEISAGNNDYIVDSELFYGDGTVKDFDNDYETDYNQMNSLGILQANNDYWLASLFRTIYTSYRIGVRKIFYSSPSYDELVRLYTRNSFNGEQAATYAKTNGFRPVFILEEGLIVTGGSGTREDPYVIEPSGRK